MIQFRLKELIAQCERKTGNSITYKTIQADTGISPNTLSLMANNKMTRVDLSVLDRLTDYLQCEIADLFFKEPTYTFFDYLKKQVHRDEPIGDFARDVVRDKNRPHDTASIDQWRFYLETASASDECLEAFESAAIDFKHFSLTKSVSKTSTEAIDHNYVFKIYSFQPYLLVEHTKSGDTAVYNRRYELLHENASQKLIDYAKANHTETQQRFDLTKPSQFPSWGTTKADMEANCVRHYLYGDDFSIDEIAKIPHE